MGRGKIKVADTDADRCEALTHMTEWKKRNNKEQRCPFESRYRVGKKKLCRHHAVVECFAICTELKHVSKIIRDQSQLNGRVLTVQD